MENSLIKKDDFQIILEEYSPSHSLLNLLTGIKLVLLVSPAAVGRNTIIEELLKTGVYHYIVSDTTRKKRVNNGVEERDGVEYWFRREQEALDELIAGDYLGPAIIHNQQFSGINIRELQKANVDSKIAITDMEIQGALEISNIKKDTINIFVLPPSYDEWMRRLESRGKMSNDEKSRRLKSAEKEIRLALDDNRFNFFINDDLSNTVRQIHDFIVHGQHTESSRIKEHARNLVRFLKSSKSSTLDV